MRAEQEEKARAQETRRVKKKKRTEAYRKRRNSTSIYFLLWAAFSAISLIIVLVCGITQGIAFRQSYGEAAAKEVGGKGKVIEEQVLAGTPEAFQGNTSAYVRYLAVYHHVNVYILDGEGNVLFPQEPHFGGGAVGETEDFDFTEKVSKLQAQLTDKNAQSVVYEGDGEYVYGSNIRFYGNTNTYLYVTRSLDLMEATSKQITERTVLTGIFVFVLSFAVSSAVSGWLTRPIAEMTKKARLLASGDFDVDFHGDNYGEEMLELAETLNFARDELSKTDEMQKELIANVSHDFKTPLTMIKAYASMIMEISGEIPEKRNKHAQVIVDEADRLASLVTDVLDLSKLQSGIENLDLQSVDMSAYLREILARFDFLKETQGYKIQASIENGLSARVDKVKIGQAIYNLIGNSVNYTGEDKTVYVRLERVNGEVFRFSVRDTGAGIKPEERAAIWERYYRSAEAHKRPVKGTGLGLSIVKAVLQRHGFYYGVESEVGEGSTFFVDFPLERENA